MNAIIEKVKGGLIVSCQALENEPLYGSEIMVRMALAAEQGGAVGIRANTPEDIRAIKERVNLPVIGLYKQHYADSEIYITPTIKEVKEVVDAGADIIAVDATLRERPGNQKLHDFFREIKEAFPNIPVMGDIATFEEGVNAEKLGFDLISTTLLGYTDETKHIKSFSKKLLSRLVKDIKIPVVAEGRIDTPELAAECIRLGAFAVVVGTAITRPQEITKKYVYKIKQINT